MELDNFKALQSAGVDTDGALRRFAGKAELYQRFLQRFPEDDNFQKLSEAMPRENWDDVLKAAHTLKGVSGNLGMTRLYDACSETVRLLRESDWAGAKASYKELEAAYRAVMAVLGQ